MQAVILVGGEGTRLRPLTSLHPKPVIQLVDRPFMVFMLEWLRGHGVDDVVLSCGFLPTKIEEALGDGSALGIRLRYVTEPEPRGTAGALKYAEDLLEDRFLMLNGDVLTDVDVSAQLRQHEATGAVGTLGLVPVEDPSAYGLVLTRDGGEVTGFLEKPGHDELVGIDEYLISAGIYVLERAVLDRIEPDRNVSIEREVWPALVGNGLYGFAARDAYWLDIGTPQRYLDGTFDIVDGNVRTAVLDRLGEGSLAVDGGATLEGRVLGPGVVGAGTRVGTGSSVGPQVVLGRGVEVGRGTRIERAVVLDGAVVGAGCELRDCIVGPGARIGDRTVVRELAMVGEGAVVGDDCVLAAGMKLFPGVELPDGAVKF
ncbi:sugar phosphate nucleotidyltransferase [Conexibacter sp. SYSU D00693]|uniref:sugar phosphate nucleotidyltransferase n=1 Tax=Conexibacter sp. SYSU D00693 TaxID=2812560 RepID=UPI00196A1FE8|nr:NDP-sugar synthase [Conexibacter sp. SYSU D00693]